ncbi:MAG TPA: EscU/YscU/HrcU family type III secretion system export apparatus switch protein [Nocardioidaceae bacterium]|nr:EscU/YscU/HrcU family type III secretion system export apparatus switch protein [Nocardioidaceae bacterium]
MSTEEKTEKATPKKLKESRKEGRVARTPELGAWAAVLVVAVSLNWLAGRGLGAIQSLLIVTLAGTGTADTASALALLGRGAKLAFLLALAIGAGVMVVGVASAVAQGGLFFATKTIKPTLSKLNPLQGAKRIFGPHALWEGAKMLLKSSLVALFVWRAVEGLMPLVGGLVPIPAAIHLAARAATGLMRDVALAGLVAAAADYAIARRRTGKQVKMTKKEVRDEHKQSEGDPLLKSAIRSRQLAAARSRMMSDVPAADVVLVNPTHVAVALRYEPSRGTPRVVAKGAGVVAAKIREIAERHRVSMVEDVPLARALHASCQVGQEIPPELYHAVAQVLAFVLSRRAGGTGGSRVASPRGGASLPVVPRNRRRVRPVVAPESSVRPAPGR